MRRFSSSPAWSLTNSCRAASSVAGLALALGADLLVEALHLGDGVGLQRGAVQVTLPADQQHAELRAPIAEVIVGDDLVAQQPQRARQTIAQDGRADVADVHGLGHVGRAEIHDHGPRLRGRLEEEVFAARGGLQGLGQRGRLEPEIKEAGAGNLHRLASIADVKLGDHVGGQLARVQLPGLGQRHEGVGLVIAELGVRAGADQDGWQRQRPARRRAPPAGGAVR